MASRARKPLQQLTSKTLCKERNTEAPAPETDEKPLSRSPSPSCTSAPSATWNLANCCEAIVYRSKQGEARASVGKLTSAKVSVGEGYLTLVFSKWQPRCSISKKTLPEESLWWPVDREFATSTTSLTIFGRSVSGSAFQWPNTYSFKGATVVSALHQHDQHQAYIVQQRAKFQACSTASTSHSASSHADPAAFEFVITQGDQSERATLAFHTAGEVPAVSAVKLSVPIIPDGSSVHEEAPSLSSTLSAQQTPSTHSEGPGSAMATSVVSLVSASSSPGAPSGPSPPPGPDACTSTPATDAEHSGQQADTQSTIQPRHDGGVLEPPPQPASGTATETQTGSGEVLVSTKQQPSSSATPTGNPAQQPANDAAYAQGAGGAQESLPNGKRYDSSGGVPRNGKLPLSHGGASEADLLARQGPAQPRSNTDHIHRRSADGSGNVQHLPRVATGAAESDMYEAGTGQQRQGTVMAASPVLADLPMQGRTYAGSNTSLESFASNHSSVHGHSRGSMGGQRWGGQQQQQHMGHPGGMQKDRRTGGKGSYGNLQSAGGNMGQGGNKHYQGRNGTYPMPPHQQGRMMMMHGSTGGGRLSVDDMMLGQHGPPAHGGAGHGRGMQRGGGDYHMGGSMGGGHEGHQTQPQRLLDLGPPEPTGTTDLERLIHQVTPMITPDCSTRSAAEALQDLCLEDVWQFYQEPSLYGREVYTLGGARGPSLSYFVPYLSAIQLFTPASPKDPGTQRLYLSDTDGWPKHMHCRYELFESELPFNRHPMYEQLEQISQRQEAEAAAKAAKAAAAAAASRPQSMGSPATSTPSTPTAAAAAAQSVSVSNQTGPDAAASSVGASSSAAAAAQPEQQPVKAWIRSAKLSELHPASWYCVAWYPVYRVPDAPLNARFLTFHSFAPLVASIQNALAALKEGQQRPLTVLPVSVVGLRWNNMFDNERWLEPLAVDGSSGSVSSLLKQDDDASSTYSAGRGGGNRRAQYGQQRPVDLHFQAHLSELQATAERLARGHNVRILGPMGVEECKQRHPDFEFFNSRG